MHPEEAWAAAGARVFSEKEIERIEPFGRRLLIRRPKVRKLTQKQRTFERVIASWDVYEGLREHGDYLSEFLRGNLVGLVVQCNPDAILL